MDHVGQQRNPLMLNPIPDLVVDEANHGYWYRGEWLATSVSEVTGIDITPVQRAAFEKYKHGPDGWAARGDAIHKAMNKHLLDEPQVYDDKWSPWVETLLEDDIFKGINLMASEYPLCLRSDTNSIGGTLDALWSLDIDDGGVGSPFVVLADLKTVSSKKAVSSRKPATSQLGGYAEMLLSHGLTAVTECVTIISGPGKCKVIREDPQDCIDSWREQLGRYNALQPDW